MRLIIILFITTFIIHKTKAQNINKASNLIQATKINSFKEPKEKILVSDAEVIYEFDLDNKTKQPFVVEETTEKLLALEKEAQIHRVKFYDDNSSILKVKNRNMANKESAVEQICGNYQDESIFYSDAKMCRYLMSLSKQGDFCTFNTQKKINDLKYFTSIYFHDIYDVKNKIVKLIVPDWLEIELKEFNFTSFQIQKKQVKDAKKNATVYEFIVSDIKGFEDQKNAPGRAHTYPHILVLSKKFTVNNQTKNIIANTNDLYNWYAGIVKLTNNQPEALKPLVNKLIESKNSDIDKIKAIYYWVQDNIRYIAFEDGIAGFKPENAQNVLQNKYGDCKGMANLAKEMLKIAGFDARLTWIGTNHIIYDYSIPSLAVDNHMICTVISGNKKYIIDPTQKFTALDDFAEQIQGRPIMIENGDSYILDQIPVLSPERNLVNINQQLKIENLNLIGKGSKIIYGDNKSQFLYFLKHEVAKQDQKKLIESYITDNDKNFNISKITTSDLSNREIPVKIDYEFNLNNQVSEFDGEWYISIDNQKEFYNFKQDEDRISNLDLEEKVARKTVLTLTIPENLQVKHLPKNLDIQNPYFTFQISYTQKDNELIYAKSLMVPKGKIPRTEFKAWNDAIKQLQAVYDDQVILIKK
jgi:hypothetical protein